MQIIDLEDLLRDSGKGREEGVGVEISLWREDDFGFGEGIGGGAAGEIEHHAGYSVGDADRLPQLCGCFLPLGGLFRVGEGSDGACRAREADKFGEGDDAAEEKPDFLDSCADKLAA